MATATATAIIEAPINLVQELRSAWLEYQEADKKGLQFGKRMYELRTQSSAQGNHEGRGFLQLLQQAGIVERTAYYWLNTYEISIGEREPRIRKPQSIQSAHGVVIKEITVEEMAAFVAENHYSTVMPRITKVCFGGFRDGTLVAAVSFGWGSRPRHTIQKLFPSLDTNDYLEVGKMCLRDEEPKNSESEFLSAAIGKLRSSFPYLKLIFSWADGMWGKAGYIYQASNFLYGGFIETDAYQKEDGTRLHPLQLQAERRTRGLDTTLRTERPSAEEMKNFKWRRFFGKQFRYVRFLCKADEKAKLIAESQFEWTTDYPKDDALAWKEVTDGVKTPCEQPSFTGTNSYSAVEPEVLEPVVDVKPESVPASVTLDDIQKLADSLPVTEKAEALKTYEPKNARGTKKALDNLVTDIRNLGFKCSIAPATGAVKTETFAFSISGELTGTALETLFNKIKGKD